LAFQISIEDVLDIAFEHLESKNKGRILLGEPGEDGELGVVGHAQFVDLSNKDDVIIHEDFGSFFQG
jgi:hypothetical protein